jgi:iron complex outermembrane receptor protein
MKGATCAIILLIVLVGRLAAQNTKEVLSGKVTDIHGQPLAFVGLELTPSMTGTITDGNGHYLIKAPAGNHTLVATLIGYHRVEAKVAITNGQSSTFSFTMEENPIRIKDIIVSGVKFRSAAATRTLVEVQDIPQSIVVVGQKVISQQSAHDLTTVVRNMSGITFTGNYGGAGSAQFFNARGFNLNDSQNYRWNGMMIWNWGNHYADNIEQVEFLKGPASILYGDVAPGGVLNFVTKKPLSEFSANIQLKTGSWGLARAAIDVGGPLTKKKDLRFRLNASFERSGSFRDFVKSSRSFIAPSLAYNITPKLVLNLETVISSSGSTDDAGLVSPDGTTAGLKRLAPSLYLGDPSLKYLFKDQKHFAGLTYELNKTWRVSAKSIFASIKNRPFGLWFDQPQENGDFTRKIYGFNQKSNNITFSLDAYGSFYSGAVKHQLLVGVDYQASRLRYTNGGELSLLDTSNIYAPHASSKRISQPSESPLRPYISLIGRGGVFLQDQVMFLDEKLQILLGLRAGMTRQGNHYYQGELAGTDYQGYSDDIIVKRIVTPRIGLVFKPKPWSSFYGSYSKGYEINSPDVFAKNYQEYAVPPATISSQIEVGSKMNLLSKRLGLTVSMFQIDKHDPYGYVYLDAANPNYDEYNVYYQGHHRSIGLELDGQGQVFPSITVMAGASFTKTKVVSDPGYPTGNFLPNTPKVAANIWLDYEPIEKLKGFSIGSGLFYKGKFFSSLTNDPNLLIPASYTLDIALGYKIKNLGLQLNALNVTNQVSYLNPWQFNLFDVRPLRQLILTLNYKFAKK